MSSSITNNERGRGGKAKSGDESSPKNGRKKRKRNWLGGKEDPATCQEATHGELATTEAKTFLSLSF